MNQYIDTLRKNERLIFIALPILMAVIFAFFPIADIFGKATANGLKLIFSSKGFGLGRLCAILSLLLPIAAVVLQFVAIQLPAKVAARYNVIWSAVSLFVILLLTVTFPDGVSLAWGGYLYCLLAAVSMAVDILLKR